MIQLSRFTKEDRIRMATLILIAEFKNEIVGEDERYRYFVRDLMFEHRRPTIYAQLQNCNLLNLTWALCGIRNETETKEALWNLKHEIQNIRTEDWCYDQSMLCMPTLEGYKQLLLDLVNDYPSSCTKP